MPQEFMQCFTELFGMRVDMEKKAFWGILKLAWNGKVSTTTSQDRVFNNEKALCTDNLAAAALCPDNLTASNTNQAKPELIPKLFHVQSEAAVKIFSDSSSDSEVWAFPFVSRFSPLVLDAPAETLRWQASLISSSQKSSIQKILIVWWPRFVSHLAPTSPFVLPATDVLCNMSPRLQGTCLCGEGREMDKGHPTRILPVWCLQDCL